jgi:hypothetical protein
MSLLILFKGSAAGLNGQVKVWNGSLFTAKPVKWFNGSAWVTKPLKYYNGSIWVTTAY